MRFFQVLLKESFILDDTMICWKCKEAIQSPVCVGCGAIQPPPPKPDYFSIFNLKRSFFISDIGAQYRKLSRMLHPDRFVKKSAVERRMSLLWTAAINEAKRCLENPISRARYLATGSAQVKEDRRITLSPQFLEMIFDMQMEAMGDPQSVQAKAEKLYSEEYAGLEQTFQDWEQSKKSELLESVEIILARMKYLQNLSQLKK